MGSSCRDACEHQLVENTIKARENVNNRVFGVTYHGNDYVLAPSTDSSNPFCDEGCLYWSVTRASEGLERHGSYSLNNEL